MTRIRIMIAVVLFAVGCNSDRASNAPDNSSPESVNISSEIAKTVSGIRVGTPEKELIAVLGAGSIDGGSVYWGGTGAKRMYFQIGPTKQIWFEIGGSYDGDNFGKVVRIGPIERKSQWTRHDGDSITVN